MSERVRACVGECAWCAVCEYGWSVVDGWVVKGG